jgi:crotonobetainyl-CoA:carnitine CoA-transferase CaiB-like acyl-CoA transferase
MSITGEPGRGPMRVGIPIADLCTGLFAALGAMTALLEREKSGEGQWVQANLLESQIFMLDFQASRWLMKHDVAKQVGNDHPTGVPTGRYKVSDGHINIAPTPAMWKRFCKAMGLDALAEDPDYATGAARRKNRDKLVAMIEELTSQNTSEYWIDRLNHEGIPCGPIYTIDQTFADPQVKFSGIAQKVASDKIGEFEIVGQPIHMSRTPSKLATATPEAGEHNDQVLHALGYSAADIEDLKKRGVI